jgi:hypothetical protein
MTEQIANEETKEVVGVINTFCAKKNPLHP